MTKNIQFFTKHTLLFITMFLLPTVALASGDTPVSEGLGYVTSAMFGSTGIVLATIAIMAVGLMCLFHMLEWKRLLQTVAGIAIIFGASGIVAAIQALISP